MRLTHKIDLTESRGEKVCTFEIKWSDDIGKHYFCSNCGHLLTEISNYCRHCGARRLDETDEAINL